jgi:hypothetical protein
MWTMPKLSGEPQSVTAEHPTVRPRVAALVNLLAWKGASELGDC